MGQAFRVLSLAACLAGLASAGPDAGDAGRAAAPARPQEPATVQLGRWSLPVDPAELAIEDLYKLLHQAFLGPGHAISSREGAGAFLRREWSSLGPARPGEALIDSLVEGSRFVRLHLRPYRDRGGSVGPLLDAFLRSALAPVDSLGFREIWSALAEAIDAGRVPFRRSAYDSLDAQVRPAGYPAVHHSQRYREGFLPAYRVVTRAEAQQLVRILPATGEHEEE